MGVRCLRRLVLPALAALAATLLPGGVGSAAPDTGPPLSVAAADLEATLVCPHAIDHVDRNVILLVPGTTEVALDKSRPVLLPVPVLPARVTTLCEFPNTVSVEKVALPPVPTRLSLPVPPPAPQPRRRCRCRRYCWCRCRPCRSG